MGATGFELNSLHDVDHQSADACGPLRTHCDTQTDQRESLRLFHCFHFAFNKTCRMEESDGVPRYAFSLFFFSVSMKSSEAALIF